MAETSPKSTTDYINEIYAQKQKSENAQLESSYAQTLDALDQAKQENQRNTDTALTRTAVEAQKKNMNWNEVQSAYGLSSGANAQARLARDNQLTADMTALRTAQAEQDAKIERQRALEGEKYRQAILDAQAQNDFQRANALLAEAQQREAQLRADKENAAALMAKAGDYSIYQQLYGLTDSQIAKLNGAYAAANAGSSTSKRSGGSGSGGGTSVATPVADTSASSGNWDSSTSSFSNRVQAENAVKDIIVSYQVTLARGGRVGTFEDWLRQNGITAASDIALANYMYAAYQRGEAQ